jgi:hypothetical protein
MKKEHYYYYYYSNTCLGSHAEQVCGYPTNADAHEDGELHPIASHASIHAHGLEAVVEGIAQTRKPHTDEGDILAGIAKLGVVLDWALWR